MKKNTFNFLLITCLSPFLVQCFATTQDMQNTNIRMRNIDQRVETVQKDLEQAVGKTVQQVQSRQARVSDQVDIQQDEILELKAQLGESAHYNRLLQERNKEFATTLNSRFMSMENSLGSRIDQLSQRIDELDRKLITTDNSIREVKETRARETAERARVAAQRAREAAMAAERKAQAAKTSRKSGPVEITPDKFKKKASDENNVNSSASTQKNPDPSETLYSKGLSEYKGKRYSEAINIFTEYLRKYPNGKKVVNARFWTGESLYGQKEFELAILEYQKVIADSPRHSKAPAALLKQAMAFEKINDRNTAQVIYNKIIKEYPSSEQAQTAKKQLN